MKILLIGYNRIGDTILSTGLISYLIKKYENASFSLITSSISASIFKDMPKLDKIIIVNKKKYAGHWFKIWNECKAEQWDLIIDLRSSYLSYFLKSKKRIIIKGNKKNHILDQLGALIESDHTLKTHIWAKEENYLDLILNKGLEKKYICIAPISNSVVKDWSIEKYIRLFNNKLFADFQIVIVGATSNDSNEENQRDKRNINRLISNISPRVLNLINNADMIETYFILKKAHLFVGSDSSNMHLAVTASIPTIGLFGPTDEKLYGPLGKNNLSLRGDKSFSEIVNQLDYKPGKTKSYLDDLSVTKVYKEIEKVLYNK